MTFTNAPKYLDADQRFGFMKTGMAATCKVLRCAIPMKTARVYDNVYKQGPICVKCAQAALGGDLAVQLQTVDKIELRIQRMEAFIYSWAGEKWVSFIKSWKPKE